MYNQWSFHKKKTVWGRNSFYAKQIVLFYICTGPKPTVSNHAFEDLLGSQGFSSSSKSNEPKTIGSMRKQILAEDMDPDKLKVCSYRLDPDKLKVCSYRLDPDKLKVCSYRLDLDKLKVCSYRLDPDKLKVCSYRLDPDKLKVCRLDFFVIDTEANTCRIYLK